MKITITTNTNEFEACKNSCKELAEKLEMSETDLNGWKTFIDNEQKIDFGGAIVDASNISDGKEISIEINEKVVLAIISFATKIGRMVYQMGKVAVECLEGIEGYFTPAKIVYDREEALAKDELENTVYELNEEDQ